MTLLDTHEQKKSPTRSSPLRAGHHPPGKLSNSSPVAEAVLGKSARRQRDREPAQRQDSASSKSSRSADAASFVTSLSQQSTTIPVMAGKQLEKQIAVALKSTPSAGCASSRPGRKATWRTQRDRWSATAARRSSAKPTAVLQFARLLNKQGVAWRDIHIEVSPGQWLVNPASRASTPDRSGDRRPRPTGEAHEPFSPAKNKDFLFDAIFEFKLASNSWDRPRASGQQPPPAGARRSEHQGRRQEDEHLPARPLGQPRLRGGHRRDRPRLDASE